MTGHARAAQPLRRVATAGGFAALVTAAAALAGALVGGGSITPVVLEGDPAPDTDDNFQNFDRPNISESGAIFFAGDTDGASDADDVIYRDATLIAKENDPAPGTVEGRYAGFEFFETGHQINASGDVVFIATLRNVPSDANRAIYRNDTLFAREGDVPPGIVGRIYDDFGFAGITDDGTVGFRGDLDGSADDDSVIVFDGVVLYREQEDVPVLEEGVWDANFDELQWNGRGDLLFEGNTSLPGEEDMVIFRRLVAGKRGVVEEIVLQEGDAVDGSEGEDFIDLFLQTALAENGLWAVRGNLLLAPPESDAFILAETGFFAQQGDPVEALEGVQLGNFNGLDINSNGDVLYLADLQGDTPPDVEEGIFINDELIVTDGMPAPGLPDGTVFSDLGFEDLYINDNGQVIFQASYTGAATGDGLFTFTIGGACPADLTGDDVVNVFDLLDLLAAWGPCPGCPADLNGDDVVNVFDLLDLLAAWGPCP
jgi:hypothetical protein